MKVHHTVFSHRYAIEPELALLVRLGDQARPEDGHSGIRQRSGGRAVEDGTEDAAGRARCILACC